MEQEIHEDIEEMMSGIHCLKEVKCTEINFKHLCKARDIGLEHNLECLESQALIQCKFALRFDAMHFCQCPVRVYFKKNLGC